MTCPTCEHWAATTEKQLYNRREIIKKHPQVEVHKCPKCGGIDWATTNAFVMKKKKHYIQTTWIVVSAIIAAMLLIIFTIMRRGL